jgi:N-acetylmuramoyl-L-alanine amidase
MDEFFISCYDEPVGLPDDIQANGQVRWALKRGHKIFSITMTTLVILAVLIGLRLFEWGNSTRIIKITAPVSETRAVPTVGLVEIKPNLTPGRALVGIVSGHKGYDPGAVCDDGVTEADVNYAIALEVVDLLTRRGVQTDLLDEFDDRLPDYKADALVSIHADSCNIPGATGFKVARVTNSAIPEAEDKLVTCLDREYMSHTGLPQHPSSITDNMTDYHAFNQIDPSTPGAIIETGFLLDDRTLLLERPQVVARGIAAGILCFLEE